MTTDNDGNFSYSPLRPGRVHFFASADNKVRASVYNFNDLAPMPDAGTLEGVASADIAPEADVEVNITLP
ncbi:MAG: hypothetical protein HY286_03030 [Planctomycetes bacterium]|nr:hypothetical protein [Planctomycetota bacterium]